MTALRIKRVVRGTNPNVGGDLLDTVLVDDLVSGEEGQSVGVVLEGFDHAKDLLHVDGVIRGPGCRPVQGTVLQRRVDIQNQVDTGRVEDGGTLVMVEVRAHVVDTDGVDLGEIHERFSQ